MENLPLTPFQHKEKVILLVDENAALREMLCLAFERETPYSVSAVPTATAALRFLHVRLPDLLIIDYELSNSTGLGFYYQMHQKQGFPLIPAILLSAPPASCVRASYPLWIVQEPFDLDTLLTTVKQAACWLEAQRAERSCHTPKEGRKTMRTPTASFSVAMRILSWGFVCGLILAPVSRFLLRSLLGRLSTARRRRKRPLAPALLMRTEYGLIVHVTPQRPPGFPLREALPEGKEIYMLATRHPALAH